MAMLAQQLLARDAEDIIRKTMVKDGDSTALRLCWDRLAPVPKDIHACELHPPAEEIADNFEFLGHVIIALHRGDLVPREGSEIADRINASKRFAKEQGICEPSIA